MELNTLATYLEQQLSTAQYKDYCPNGLQVQGKSQVNKLVTGVSACLALLNAAHVQQADAILVHHGYFWRGESACIVGAKYQRLQLLLQQDISLLAYHLPLDAHPVWGNNVQLAQVLGIKNQGPINHIAAPELLFHGQLDDPMSGETFKQHIATTLAREPLHIAGDAPTIQRIAWCTGGAQSYIDDAIAAGVDAYLTGEASEQTVHAAREAGIHFFAAGHHATERYGVQALGQHLAQHFGIEHQFIDIDNPV